MNNESTSEWQDISPAEAEALIECDPSQYCGYVTIDGQMDGCLLCQAGGRLLGKANGVPPDYAVHLYRSHGLPPANFTDRFEMGSKALRPGRGEGLADLSPNLSLFRSISPGSHIAATQRPHSHIPTT